MLIPSLVLMAGFPAVQASAANFPLQVIQPQAGLGVYNRYYRAYPGLRYRVPIGVFGGSYPFTYSLVSAPSGMSIDARTGIIDWPSPAAAPEPYPVTVGVTDSEGSAAQRSWSISVTTRGFIFLDAQNGAHALGFGCSANCGDGSLGRPFRSLIGVYRGTDYAAMSDGTYNDHFIYFRAGTYGLEGYFSNTTSSQQYELEWRGQFKPVVWLAYPGEAVVVDHNLTPESVSPLLPAGSAGAFIDFRNGNSDDAFIHGIRFQDMRNHAFRLTNNRAVFFENSFFNLGPGVGGENSSFIMFSGRELNSSNHVFVRDNVFDTLDTGALVKTYGLTYSVIENNVFRNGSGSPLEGLALKHADRHVDVRSNFFDGAFGSGAINGNWNDDGNMEIRFNTILNSPLTYSDAAAKAMTINHDALANNPVYIYRNTIEGTVFLRYGAPGNGPFRFYDNVVVNENAGTPAGSHVTFGSVADASVFLSSGNLAAYPADNVIDADGNLTSAYASYRGARGAQLGLAPAANAPPGRPRALRAQ